ncbi:disease resistance protein RGA2-like [Panicum miliaceum]|uniref:Disease resistance protein RGA2-like n=1 Tax=Panicum miliaceum TaxID=4540 RepID=A0A3L6RLJ3_PANMI|nr:disease resistance protein RGA2-like [Panicum miliaceum]
MAELVIGPLLSMVKEKASSYLLEHYKVMEGMEEQRKILERNLPAILYIIQDAEEKGASRPDVAAWIKDLKIAAYEANDVFVEFKYEALRREAKKKGQHSKLGTEIARLLVPARNPIVFRYRMGKKLRRIVQTIEDLVTEMNKFDFRHLQQAQPSRQWRQTDSIIIDSDRDIVSRSRDEEKKKIVGMLLDQASSDMDLMVLPIVGPGGMGKTTFVQLIYNDHEIRKHFELQRIVDRCAGSPLAAKAFGSMLSDKTSMDEWKYTLAKKCATIVGKPTVNKLLQNPTRHIFLSVYGASVVFEKRLIISSLDHLLKKQTAMLQTLFFTDYYHRLEISQYTSLRALHLPATAYSVQKHLTGQIQHLRYLNLSGHTFVQLPEDISIMYNLQTLDLSYCINLRQLPMGMKYMASLRHLYTTGCESLTCMPPGLGQLTTLQTLTYFVAGASSNCSTIGELGNLNLAGELELSGLENTLRIVNYRGTSLPSWVTDLRKLQHLTELHLSGCTLCEEFPQFHHFKALEVLYLEKLDKLQSLCSDMVFAPFPALKQLDLHDLESLERWVATGGKEGELTFPALEEIDIENCPKLSSLPEAPKLKVIRLDEGNSLLSLGIVKSRHMTSLSKLELSVRDTEASPQTDPNCCSSQQLEPSFGDREAAPLLELSISGCNFFFFSSQSEITFAA